MQKCKNHKMKGQRLSHRHEIKYPETNNLKDDCDTYKYIILFIEFNNYHAL